MKARLPSLTTAVLALGFAGVLTPGLSSQQGRAGADDTKTAAPATNAAAPAKPPASADGARAAAPNPADRLVNDAAELLRRQAGLSARLRYRVDVLGKEMVGTGTYLQGAGGSRQFRLELTLQLENRATSLLHVSDGQTLWIRRQLLGEPTLSRVDLRRLAAVEERARNTPGNAASVDWLSLGGLPKLAHGLDAYFHFDSYEERKLGEVPIWQVRGGWNADRLARFKLGEPADLAKLPPHMPDEALVSIGRDDGFPYRMEFRRTHPPVDEAATSAAEPRTMLVLEFYDVKLNAAVDSRQFSYSPGEQDFSDLTGHYLKSFGLDEKPH